MTRLAAVIFLPLLAACVTETEPPPDGVILETSVSDSWGFPEGTLMMSDGKLNADGTRTIFVQYLSAGVSDDDIAAIPARICRDPLPRPLATEVTTTPPERAVREGTLTLSVTCGA